MNTPFFHVRRYVPIFLQDDGMYVVGDMFINPHMIPEECCPEKQSSWVCTVCVPSLWNLELAVKSVLADLIPQKKERPLLSIRPALDFIAEPLPETKRSPT